MRALWLVLLTTACLTDDGDDTASGTEVQSGAPDAVAQEFVDAHNAIRAGWASLP